MTSQSRPSPEKANQEGRNYVVIEWFQSKKTQVCLVDEVNNMDDPPKKGTKKYNVISGKDKSGRLETKPALILHGPGTFCEMQEMEKLRKLDADCVFPGERPKRIRRLPAKNLETADEEDRPRSPSKKMGKKAHGTSNMQIDLLNAISRAKEVNLPSDEDENNTSLDGPGATQENLGKERKKASKKCSTQEKRAPKTNTVTKTGAANKDTTTQKVNIHSSQERSRPLAKSAGSMRLDGGRGNNRPTAGSSKMPEKGKEKVQFTESLAAGTGDGEDSDTSFDGPGATQENVGKESKKASKKYSTQEKRAPKTNTVTKTGAANKDTTTQKVNIHSSQERSRPLAKSGDSMRLDGGRGNYRSTAGSSKMLEKEHDEDADSTDHREVETHSSEERRRQIQREWSSDGLFSDWDDAVVQGESSHEVDPLPSRSSQFVGKKPSLASEDRSCCCSVEMLQLIHVLDSKIDLLLKSSAAMRGTQAASDEPDLLQIVCNNYNYIGNGYVLLRGRYASVDMYTSQRPARFVTQMTKAVFGDDILSRSRLNAERGDFLALDCKLVECIFLSQRAYCEMNNLTPLTMAATRRIVSNVCQRANPNTSVWTSHGYRQLTEVVPTADCDDASHTDTE
ncbi:uncharacterized protein LOC135946606 isoform X1 [Cloeon dipterum]|uniref:uncharacterized protein LOC135946606 isoform X1 n=1 Tax=Cloeon dipterum TaxID=197152 RepID=UPI00321FE874